MIIDSHTHYAHIRFDSEFPYLCRENDVYAVQRADRGGLIREMCKQGIVGCIEPSIGFDNIDKQLRFVSEHPSFAEAAVGVHPTRCFRAKWKNRKKIKEYAENGSAVAIGETGLDYHQPRREQHRFVQLRWFVYQIKLADRLELPLVLHIRNADKSALKILKKYRSRLHGGVVHCFSGDAELAKKYIALGFTLGIGGTLLCDDEKGRRLCETVRQIPLSSILVETDAPFVFPDFGELSCSRNQRKKLCNSSLILPMVIGRIGELRGESCERVEDEIYRNTLRVFKLRLQGVDTNE